MSCTEPVVEAEPKSVQCGRDRVIATLEGRKRLLVEIRSLEEAYQTALTRLVPEEAGHVASRQSDQDAAEANSLHSLIREMRDDLSRCVEAPPNAATVAVGTCVSVLQHGRRQDMCIVGPVTANPLLGRISYLSPLGKALLGRCVGESVSLAGQYGSSHLKIVGVKMMVGDEG